MYPPETRNVILERIAQGESLRSICAGQDMPSRETVRLWLRDDPAFLAECARAREEQAETLFDEMADIEERTLSGEIKADVARVVLASRQWRAAKLKPRVYGDKTETTHQVGESIQEIVRTIVRAPAD